jgi:hypothetical protein
LQALSEGDNGQGPRWRDWIRLATALIGLVSALVGLATVLVSMQ